MPAAYEAEEKRRELVLAGAHLFYRQGFRGTKLADLATESGVSLGNVYYYFKTKEELAAAVVEAHLANIVHSNAELERHTPLERLRRFVRRPLAQSDHIVLYGCPHGSLCQELEKLGPDVPLARLAARLLVESLEWLTHQLAALGAGRRARGAAIDVMASMQGAMLMAHTLRSSDVLVRQIRELERRLVRTYAD